MEKISLKPDIKLILKNILIIFTVTIFVIIAAIILQIVIPIDEKVTGRDVAEIVWPFTTLTILVYLLISLPIIFFWVKNLTYSIEDERITIYKGILTKMQQNIPYRVITNLMLHRSLHDRMLGLGSIRIQTAGQTRTPTGYEGNLAGLINYNILLDALRERVKKYLPEMKESMLQKNEELKSFQQILQEILKELQVIRRKIELK